MLAEPIPKAREQRNLRYSIAKQSHNKASTGRKKINKRYGRKPTVRLNPTAQQKVERDGNTLSNNEDVSRAVSPVNTDFIMKTTYKQQDRERARLLEGTRSRNEHERASHDAYVTSLALDRQDNFILDDHVDDHVAVSGETPHDDYWRSSSPGGAEFITNATYRRHQKEKSRRSKEMEAG